MNNNKVVIITGASKGIGLSTALKFAANNYNVTLVGRDQEELDQIKLKIEKQEKDIENEFRKDLAEVRRVMWLCYAVAAVVAWYLTWGYKG